jgi:hypothetical protein
MECFGISFPVEIDVTAAKPAEEKIRQTDNKMPNFSQIPMH